MCPARSQARSQTTQHRPPPQPAMRTSPRKHDKKKATSRRAEDKERETRDERLAPPPFPRKRNAEPSVLRMMRVTHPFPPPGGRGRGAIRAASASHTTQDAKRHVGNHKPLKKACKPGRYGENTPQKAEWYTPRRASEKSRAHPE